MAALEGDGEGARIADSARRLVGLMARLAGWRPDELWAATPADVAAVLAGWRGDGEAADGAGIDRTALAAMMEQYPDG
ncbi:phage tail assembly chaperone [Sphingopyxis sp. MWB1]|uniref:phage tail assembly chaperone n=1 Tax=Sphingopyxis sp. MWB1 TaxID=1537715 RepID=UPI00051A70CB|nr:phage tail assembly chaperone [Sphingopyxis sp. MWB1]